MGSILDPPHRQQGDIVELRRATDILMQFRFDALDEFVRGPGGLLEDIEQSFVSKKFTVRVLGIWHTVGKGAEHVAGT